MVGRTERLRCQLGDDLEALLAGCAGGDAAAWRRLLDVARPFPPAAPVPGADPIAPAPGTAAGPGRSASRAPAEHGRDPDRTRPGPASAKFVGPVCCRGVASRRVPVGICSRAALLMEG